MDQAAAVIDAYLERLDADVRRLAGAHWGVTIGAEVAGGWPLEIGVRIADDLVRVQAPVTDHSEHLDPWLFLHWNRQTRLVRFASTRAGEVWIHGDTPIASVDDEMVDRLLGLLVEGAQVARRYATEA